MQIDLAKISKSDNKIQYELHIPRPLKKYFLNDSSYVQYDDIIDSRNIHNSILAIPIVSVLAPVAWAVGADVQVPELDANYLQSLKRIKEVFRSFPYPFSFTGDVCAENEFVNEFGGKRAGVLFSGGVDSLASYLRHKQEKPDLISICGLPDIPPFEQEFRSRIHRDMLTLANHDGISAFQVKTDMLMNLNQELLTREFGVWWYPHVAVGLFLLSLCAPITSSRGIRTVFIASSFVEGQEGHLGTHPSTDNIVSWADVNVVHDGYELSRQQKLRFLCQEENLPYLSNLRVCNETARAWKTNCGNCEKCMRTIVGLLLENVDPSKCNFAIDAKTFPFFRDCFLKGRIAPSPAQLFIWQDMQKHIPDEIRIDIHGSQEFLIWLKNYDLLKYRPNKLRLFLGNTARLYRNGRMKTPYLTRKIKCYLYIVLSKLKLL